MRLGWWMEGFVAYVCVRVCDCLQTPLPCELPAVTVISPTLPCAVILSCTALPQPDNVSVRCPHLYELHTSGCWDPQLLARSNESLLKARSCGWLFRLFRLFVCLFRSFEVIGCWLFCQRW